MRLRVARKLKVTASRWRRGTTYVRAEKRIQRMEALGARLLLRWHAAGPCPKCGLPAGATKPGHRGWACVEQGRP